MTRSIQKLIPFLFLFTGITYTVNAQDSGPGGVGDDSSNRFWFIADQIDQTNGSDVLNWNNLGGNALNAIDIGNPPSLITNQLNGLSVLNFDSSNNEILEIPNNNDLNSSEPYSERTFSMVMETGSDVTSRQMIYEEGGASRGLNFYIYDGKLYYAGWNLQNDDPGGSASPWGFSSVNTPISANSSYILTFVFNGNNTSTGIIECYLNGSKKGTINNIGLLYTHLGSIGLGRVNGSSYIETGTTSNNHSFNGSIAEFIIYNFVINDSERISVENYLSSKYDISLSNDIYNQDLAANGNYDNNLVSINRQSASDEHLTTSQGIGLISLSTSATLNNNDHFSIGSDVLDQTQFGNISCNINGKDVTRLQSTWRVDKVGSFTPDIIFDLINSNADVTNTSDIQILIDDNVSFSSPVSVNPSTLTASEATFTGLSIADGDYIAFDLAVERVITNTIAGLALEDELQFSFEANTIDQENQTDVNTWSNTGQSNLNATTQGNPPNIETNALNGQKALNFDGSNSESFEISDNAIINSGGAPYLQRTYSLVIETGSDISSRQVIYEEGGLTRGINIYILNNELYFGAFNNNNDGTASPWSFTSVSTSISANTTYVITNVFNANNTITGTLETYLNGNLVGTVNNVGYLYDHGGNISIGQNGDGHVFENGQNNSDLSFTGKLAEFLFYDIALDSDQADILNNHLAAKYGITPTANDIYAYDTNASGDHDFNLAGIRQTSTSTIDSTTYSTGILKISNPSSLNAGDHLIAATDEQDLSLLDTESVNCNNTSASNMLLNGTWRVDINGTPGTVDLEFDYKSINVNIDNTQSNLKLLVDDNPGFTSPTTISPDLFCSNIIFENVSLNNGDYFTLQKSNIQPVVWNGTNWNEGSGSSNDPTIDDTFKKLVINGSGASLSENAGCTCLIIDSGADLDLSNNDINIKNDANISGTLIANSSRIGFNGEVNQNINGNGFTASDLFVDNENQLNLSLNTDERIEITNLLDVQNATLNTNDDLTLKSTATNTAQIDQLSPSSAINGSVTIERYFPARRAFRLISSSTNTNGSAKPSIQENWQEGATSYQNNPIPNSSTSGNFGYGTHITGNNTSQTDNSLNNGLDWSPSGNPSLFTFDNSAQSWNAVTNTKDNTLAAGDPYRLMVRGDRSIDISDNGTIPENTKLRSTGSVLKGQVTINNINGSSGNASLIGNPYQAVVDMDAVITSSTNLRQYFIIWDPTLGGQNPTPGQPGGRGAFVSVDATNGDTSVFDSDGNTTSETTNMNQYLQPYQAAFVLTGSGSTTPNVVFEETHKSVSQSQVQVFSNDEESHYLNIRLFDDASYSNGATPDDGVRFYFSENSSNAINDLDAPKFNNIDENLATWSENTALLSIENRAMPTENDSLQLYNTQYRDIAYVFELELGNFPDNDVYLYDSHTDQQILLNENTLNTYSYSVDPSISSSAAWNRFSIIFETETFSISDEELQNKIKLFPNPAKDFVNISFGDLNLSEAQISISDMQGRQIKMIDKEDISTDQIRINTSDLSQGIYFVKINSGQFQHTDKLIVE